MMSDHTDKKESDNLLVTSDALFALEAGTELIAEALTADPEPVSAVKDKTKKANIHEGHRGRLKARCIQEGLASFTEHQLLELLLFYAIPYRDTNELAHQLIDYYGSFSAVLDADYHELLQRPGVGPNTALLLSMLPGMFRRYQLDRWGEKVRIDNLRSLGDYVVNLFIGCNYEEFYLICLDSQDHVTQAALINKGTLNEVSIYPRVVVETALRHKARSVVLAHNHPGGSLRPTSGDMHLTRRLISILQEININVVDHIIVAGERYLSFADKGLITPR